MVFKTLIKLATPRVPLIKFRKGGGGGAAGPPAGAVANQASSNVSAATNQGYSSNAIEDWELPPRYKRKPLDPFEIEYINRGGPA